MTARGMSAAMLAEIVKENVRSARLVTFHFASGIQRYTETAFPVVWGGNAYTAGAGLLEIGDIGEDAALRVNDVEIVMAGADQTHIATALTADTVHREVEIHLACFDAGMGVIPDPLPLFTGYIDGYDLLDAADATVRWRVSSHWSDFDRIGGRRTNDAEQQRLFLGDRGFEYAGLVVTDRTWGRTGGRA